MIFINWDNNNTNYLFCEIWKSRSVKRHIYVHLWSIQFRYRNVNWNIDLSYSPSYERNCPLWTITIDESKLHYWYSSNYCNMTDLSMQFQLVQIINGTVGGDRSKFANAINTRIVNSTFRTIFLTNIIYVHVKLTINYVLNV